MTFLKSRSGGISAERLQPADVGAEALLAQLLLGVLEQERLERRRVVDADLDRAVHRDARAAPRLASGSSPRSPRPCSSDGSRGLRDRRGRRRDRGVAAARRRGRLGLARRAVPFRTYRPGWRRPVSRSAGTRRGRGARGRGAAGWIFAWPCFSNPGRRANPSGLTSSHGRAPGAAARPHGPPRRTASWPSSKASISCSKAGARSGSPGRSTPAGGRSCGSSSGSIR